ncbi:MAG: hypothetical protein FD180_4296 [Planctomycetota bacterium]|nr:MAG: hypothetical protein FD180_4296 [Planctomycetota bacterium]
MSEKNPSGKGRPPDFVLDCAIFERPRSPASADASSARRVEVELTYMNLAARRKLQVRLQSSTDGEVWQELAAWSDEGGPGYRSFHAPKVVEDAPRMRLRVWSEDGAPAIGRVRILRYDAEGKLAC